MKVFISHSSRQNLFVKQVKRMLPGAIDVWDDSKDLSAGEQIDEALRRAIADSDVFLLVVDDHAAESGWVRGELELALDLEKSRSEPLLLPIVLDEAAWHHLVPGEHRGRKYLEWDFDEESLPTLQKKLTDEIVAWLCRQRHQRTETSESLLSKVEEAEDLQQVVSAEIRTIVHPYRRSRPLAVEQLAQALVRSSVLSKGREEELAALLERLRRAHLLEGIYFDSEVIYLTEERFTFKSRIYQDAKRRIGKLAVSMVEPGFRIAIDGGSTTLEVARGLAQQVRGRALSRIEVFTNSLPAAHELLDTLNELAERDSSMDCRVSMLGGWCRPASMTVVPSFDLEDRFAVLPERLDIAFVGTNGLYRQEGVAVKHEFEGPTKAELLRRSDRKVVVADPSKLLVQQNEVFGRFEDGLELVTARVEGMESAVERTAALLSKTPSKLVVAE